MSDNTDRDAAIEKAAEGNLVLHSPAKRALGIAFDLGVSFASQQWKEYCPHPMEHRQPLSPVDRSERCEICGTIMSDPIIDPYTEDNDAG